MRAFAQALDLVDDEDRINAYEAYHKAVWPEVLAALRGIGIERMRIYRTGTRLFMYFEARDEFDHARDFATYVQADRCPEWEELMRGYQRQVPTATEGAWWTPMELVFDLEAQ